MAGNGGACAGFIGFAVGRTAFWDPLVGLRDKKITRDAAVNEISRRYQEFVNIFEEARASSKKEERGKVA